MTQDVLRLAREALEIGRDCAAEVAQRLHAELAGYRKHVHDAAAADVAKIDAAIAALDALPAPSGEPADKMPEALRLANALEGLQGRKSSKSACEAAAELRRLHAANEGQTRMNVTLVMENAELLRQLLTAQAAPAPQAEPVATLWQHCETGRTRVTMPDQVFTQDATWDIVGPLYLHPTQGAANSQAILDTSAADQQRESMAMMLRRCAHALKKRGRDDLAADVVGLLRRYDLLGSPLRADEAAQAAPAPLPLTDAQRERADALLDGFDSRIETAQMNGDQYDAGYLKAMRAKFCELLAAAGITTTPAKENGHE